MKLSRNRMIQPLDHWLGRRWIGNSLPQIPVWIVGAPRSGSTLLYQLLALRFRVGYLSNAHCRWQGAPGLAERWLKGGEVAPPAELDSQYGNTSGRFGPSECGQFWYRFFPKQEHYVPASRWPGEDRARARAAVGHLASAFGLPVVFKNLMNTGRLEALASGFPEGLFLAIYRNEADNARSLLRARRDKLGGYGEWFSLKPPHWRELQDSSSPVAQVLEQVRWANRMVTAARGTFGNQRFLSLSYEDLCRDPEGSMQQVGTFMAGNGAPLARRSVTSPSPEQAGAGSPLPEAMEAELRELAA